MKLKLDESSQNLSQTCLSIQLKDKPLGFEHYQNQCKLGFYKSDWIEEGIAFQNYKRLADDGDFNAQLNLGFIYYAGFHNKRGPNFAKSNYYYSLAYQSYKIWANELYQLLGLEDGVIIGPRLVIESMTVLTSNRTIIPIPPEFGIKHYANQCNEGVFNDHWIEDGASFHEYKNSADNGNLAAQLNLGFIYKTGLNLQHGPRLKEAKKYYQLAALQLGMDGCENNFARIDLKILHPNLLNLYGFIYATIKKQYSKAWAFYKLAADLGHPSAPKSLIDLHFDNKFLFENSAQTARYYRLAFDCAKQYNDEILFLSVKAAKHGCKESKHFLLTKGKAEEKAQNFKLAKFCYRAADDMGKDELIALNTFLEKQLMECEIKNDIKNATKLLFEDAPIHQGLLHQAIQNNNDTMASLLISYGANINELNQNDKTVRELNPICFYRAWARMNDYYIEVFMLIYNFQIPPPKELVYQILIDMHSFLAYIPANEYIALTKEAEYNIITKAISLEYTRNSTFFNTVNFTENLPLEHYIEKAFLDDNVMLKTLQKLHYITDKYQLDISAPRAFKIAFNALDRYPLVLTLIAKEIKRLDPLNQKNNTFWGISLEELRQNSDHEIIALQELKGIIEAFPEDLALEITIWESKYQAILSKKRIGFDFFQPLSKIQVAVEKIKGVIGVRQLEEVDGFWVCK